MSAEIRDLLSALAPSNPSSLTLRQGTVTATNSTEMTITVTIGGGTVEASGIHYMDPYSPTVGDVVWMLIDNGDVLVIGKQVIP